MMSAFQVKRLDLRDPERNRDRLARRPVDRTVWALLEAGFTLRVSPYGFRSTTVT